MKKKESILIIGNGESILNYDLGNKIDNHPTVARINNYKLKNFEKKIGSKTDIWINGANSKLKKRKNYANQILVFIPSQILSKKQNYLDKYVSNRLKLEVNKFQIIPLELIKNFEEKIKHHRLQIDSGSPNLGNLVGSMSYHQFISLTGSSYESINISKL